MVDVPRDSIAFAIEVPLLKIETKKVKLNE
jgi:hypothetical protein